MRILVAGGAGFIGSHLCERLLKQKHQVICVDNLITGSLDNIKEFKKNTNFTFVIADVIKPLNVKGKIDQVYHFASPASPSKDYDHSYHALPFETMWVNTIGTKNLCELAVRNHAKLLFASTSECYGDPLEHPQKETYRGNVSTTGPRSVYDEAKRFGETIVAAFVRSKDLDGRIIRIFNTYGPLMNPKDGRVLINFIVKAQNGEDLPIFGTGKQTRSPCFVDDLVSGIIMAMNKPKTKGEVINLGNPDEFTILELAETVKSITNSKSEIVFAAPLPADDPMRRKPDITKAQNLLGWTPKVSLKEALVKMVGSLT